MFFLNQVIFWVISWLVLVWLDLAPIEASLTRPGPDCVCWDSSRLYVALGDFWNSVWLRETSMCYELWFHKHIDDHDMIATTAVPRLYEMCLLCYGYSFLLSLVLVWVSRSTRKVIGIGLLSCCIYDSVCVINFRIPDVHRPTPFLVLSWFLCACDSHMDRSLTT